MGTKESTQEMTETREFDLPQDGFQLKNHPWLAADVTVEDEIREIKGFCHKKRMALRMTGPFLFCRENRFCWEDES